MVLIQERQIFFVRRMDIKRQLEGAGRQFWQAYEFAKLMGLESERRALMLERTVWTTPACHRREALRRTSVGHRPCVKDYWLADRPPGEAARWDGAIVATDIRPDREECIVPLQPKCASAARLPDLGETRIEVQVSPASEMAEQRLEREMAGDVDQEIGRSGQANQVAVLRPPDLRSMFIYQRG